MAVRKDCWMEDFESVVKRSNELKDTIPDEYHEMINEEAAGILRSKIWTYLEG